MGSGCCKQEVENNPDGTPKDSQTTEQIKGDPADLRRWAKDGDTVELERLLKRMPVKCIRSGAKRSEVVPEEEGQTALHLAASRGYLPCCELLVLYGAAVNCRDAKGATPLHVALGAGRRQVAQFLLEHGADMNIQDASGASPFLRVLLSGRKRVASWLLQHCEQWPLNVQALDHEGLGPITVAARHGWWDLMKQLVDMAADSQTVLNTRNSEGETALAWALKYGAAGLLTGPELRRVVSGLLERGASTTVPLFKEEIPPLCLAAATGDEVVLADLRAHGAPLHPAVCKDAVGRTALHYAAAKGHEAICELLQHDGASVGLHAALLDAAGNTPLHLAAARGHGEVARSLLERCDDKAEAILTPNRDGISVYHLFLKSGPTDNAEEGILWMLTQLSAEQARTPIKATFRDAVLATPLLMAVGSHQERVVAALLDAGHDPNEATADGVTPLSRCLAGASAPTCASDASIFRQLVEKGAKMQAASDTCHPLLAICMNPISRFAEMVVPVVLDGLLKEQELERAADAAGASADGQDAENTGASDGTANTAAVDSAADDSFADRSAMDNAAVAKPLTGDAPAADPWAGRADAAGRGPLHLAALYNNAFMVRYLLDEVKVEVDGPSGEGFTPLMYAAVGCSTHAMRILLNRRADPRATDSSRASVLSYCLRLDKPESLECAAMLLLMGAAPEDCMDGRGEGLLHRAVRYGCSEFIRLWARYGGNLCLLASTADAADDLPEELEQAGLVELAGLAGGGGGKGGRGGKAAEDYLDKDPVPIEVEDDGEDGAWDNGDSDSADGAAAAPVETKAAGDSADSDGGRTGAVPIADETDMPSIPGTASGPIPDANGALIKVMRSARHRSVRVASPAGGRNGSSVSSPVGSRVGSRAGSRRSGIAADGTAAASGDGAAAADADTAAEGGAEPSGDHADSGARAVAEAVEAEAERYPSFCRRPSMREVRRWAKCGVEWFDDALPTCPHPGLGLGSTHPSLPLPPGEEEEAAEEEATQLAEQGRQDTLAVLDPDAILRRMLLARIKDRRRGGSSVAPPGGAASGGAAAATAAAATAAGADDWMLEVVQEAENAIAALGRGAAAAAGGAATVGGSGSRAVRGVPLCGGRSQAVTKPCSGGRVSVEAAAAELGADAALASPPHAGPVAEALEVPTVDGFALPSVPGWAGDAANLAAGSAYTGVTGWTITVGGTGASTQVNVTVAGKLHSVTEDLKDECMDLASMLVDRKVSINDPYYKPDRCYHGVPRYMDDNLIDTERAPPSELSDLADSLAERLECYPEPVDELLLRGPDLRERNMRWYNQGLSPAEYPLKAGQWRAVPKKARQAAAAARNRRSVGPGHRVSVRSRRAWFGLPAMPSRPELRSTSALVYAVRLARPACVCALLDSSLQTLNVPDGWGHTPVAYAAYMLARGDPQETRLRQVYDLLLERLPQVNFTRLDAEDGNVGHSLLCPVNLAVITGDAPRLAHLVLRCAGAINCSWTALLDIPAYLNGTWERAVARCDSRCPPLALAVLSKKIDMVKLVLDLGADPNAFGEARDVRLKARRLKEYEEEQERTRRLASAYEGVLSKTRVGLIQRLARIKRAIAAIEIPGITRPHPFVTPLHLAARTGQPQVAFLLLRRGALANGAGAVPFAKKSPLQEAVMYARANYTVTDPSAPRVNWKEVRPSLEDIPAMSYQAAKKVTQARVITAVRFFSDPTLLATKAIVLAAKYAVNLLLEMRKRPIAHWDPALATAHVLLAHRAPYDLAEPQTAIVLRDLMDNGTWKWLRRPGGARFVVHDPQWTAVACAGINSTKGDPRIGYAAMQATPKPREYKRLKQQFVSKADEAYFSAGSAALHMSYQACADTFLAQQRQYLLGVMRPASLAMAGEAMASHVNGVKDLLAAAGAARTEDLLGAAAELAAGPVLSEEGCMEPQPFEAFELPATEAAPPDDADAPTAAQAAAAAALRSLSGLVAAEESWERVMRWQHGGVYLGPLADGQMETLSCGQAELTELKQDLAAVAGVDAKQIEENLASLQERVDVKVEELLSKVQEAQDGLSNLLEVIGIDFLDVL